MSGQSAKDLLKLAEKCYKRGDYQGTINWAEQAEGQARRDGGVSTELSAIDYQVIGWANIGDSRKGLEAATRLMSRAKQEDNARWLLSGTRLFVNRVAAIDLRNRWHEIRPLLLDGLATAQRLGNQEEEVEHLRRLGEYAIAMDELEQGYEWLQMGLAAITSQMQSADFYYFVIYCELSNLMIKRENYSEAVRYGEMAIGAAERDGNPSFAAGAQLQLVFVEWKGGELGNALGLGEVVLAEVERQGWQKDELWACYMLGEMRRQLGHVDLAVPLAERGLALAQALTRKEEEVEAYLSLGQALWLAGETAKGRVAVERGRRLSQERDYEDHFETAEALLASWGAEMDSSE